MKQTPETIKKKWDLKAHEMKLKRLHQLHYKIEEMKEKVRDEGEKEMIKKENQLKRKANAYITKKETEYKRKCANEIRKLQGKAEKVYKPKPLKNTQKLQIALAILQENCRLRDTDKNGNCRCISCDRKCIWEDVAGGHRHSRKLLSICLRPENVNAQCHRCNYTTGPRGDTKAKQKTNEHYRENLIKKYGDQVVAEMEQRVKEETRNPHKYRIMGPYLDELVPELIKENKKLRATKSPEFLVSHKPGKNRQKVYEKYRNLSNN